MQCDILPKNMKNTQPHYPLEKFKLRSKQDYYNTSIRTAKIKTSDNTKDGKNSKN